MNRLWFELEPHLPFLLEGFYLTVVACLLAIAGAVVIGALVASMKTARSRGLTRTANLYTEIFRNVPFVVQLFFLFYGLPEIGIYIGAFETGVMALSLAGGAFVADTIRSGILSIDKGVIESAQAFGLSRWHIFSRIMMPIALCVSIRPMGSVLVNLVLTSSILSTITVNELTGNAKIIAAQTFRPFEVYAALLVFYASITFTISQLVSLLHKRLNRHMGTV